MPGTVSQKMICTIDILPTLAHLAGAGLPENPIDGKNLWDLITGRGNTTNPHEYYAFSTGNTFEGLFSGDGKWKLHVPHQYRSLVKVGNDGQPGTYEQKLIGLSLFDMENDPLETTNVIDKYPEIVSRLQELANKHKEKFYNANKR